MSNNPDNIKTTVSALFDLVAGGYDNPSLRFFPFCADALIHLLRPKPGCKILDVATGTGHAAVAAAQTIGSSGRVQAIDLSDNMIDKAIFNANKMALSNIDFHLMDAEKLEFKSHYFDYVMCSFGIFFIPDMDAALKSWLRVLKPDGSLAFTIFDDKAFRPMADMFRSQLQDMGVQFEQSAWQRLSTEAQCQQLLSDAGACNIETHQKQMGYHLNNAENWWDVIWNSGTRGYLEQLQPQQIEEFKQKHLQEIGKLVTDKGLWMDVNVIFSKGYKALEDKHD